jgi:dolichol-phosphate mannosyltransferase
MASPKTIEISVVTPVYQARDCLGELYRRLVDVLQPLPGGFEIVMVNDASPDDSWQQIQELAGRDGRVRGIDLSRNFGQHCAITAGIDHARGEWVVVMDCDLQHRPEAIPQLYRKAKEGYDIVFARRARRRDTLLKRLLSKAFSAVYNTLSDVKLDNSISNFSIVSRDVVENVRRLREANRSYPLLLRWLGYRTACIEVEHSDRFAGESSYNLRRSVRFAVESITAQSNKPLWLSIYLGFGLSFFSLLFGLYYITRYFLHGIGVPGWTSVIVSLYFIGGLLFANLGVLGLYLGNVFNQTKNRPLYVVRRGVNLDEDRPG